MITVPRERYEMNGVELIARERQRQIENEGWTPDHDDKHASGQMVGAARAYAKAAQMQICGLVSSFNPPLSWDWDEEWWKPSPDPIRNLVKAGALIAAEIDRITRSREPKGDCLTCKHAWKYHLPYGEYPNGCRVTVEQDGEKCHCPCKPS